MRRARALTVLTTAVVLGLTPACSLVGSGDDDPTAADTGGAGSSSTGAGGTEGATGDGSEVVLVTHESFVLPQKVERAFEQQSGYDLVVRASGDAGSLTNKLVLTKDSPTGDVAFGVDNTFASRALEEGVFAPYAFDAPAGVSDYAVPGDDEQALTAVDNGNVCVNVDETWFAERDLEPPASLDDLTDPAYRDLLVVPGATTSSPGLAFLLATIAEYGEDWPDYWADLMDNGAKLVDGWSDAYQTDFTQGGGSGDRPVVVSYDSSPAFTLADDGTSTTRALLDTCFQQVEYVGVLAGAENVAGAEALVRFMTGPEVQAALPESMYVFPVVEGTELPADWAQHAERPTDPYEVDPAEIATERATWLQEWTDVVTR